MKDICAEEFRSLKNKKEKAAAVVFYTPLCGTCQIALQMTKRLEDIFETGFAQADINAMPDIAREEQISSVPCLKVIQDGRVVRTIYAFESLPSLLKRLHGWLPLRDGKEGTENEGSS
ncbi:thioredoxin family protein [Salibacterium sp. K-3]